MQGLEPIDVRQVGSGAQCVVVLHGGPGAPGSAAGLAHALAPCFHVLEPLQRRSGSVPLTVSQHVADLAEIAPRRAALVGWSWGAMLGLSYAARFPERVSELALVGCGTYDVASREQYRRSLRERLGEAGLRRVRELEERLLSEPEDAEALRAELGEVHMEAQRYELIDGEPVVPPLPVDIAGNTETWQDALRLQGEGLEPAAFSAVTARVMMIHGDVDAHPGPSTRDLLRRFIPALEYVELSRCGHEPWRERHAKEPFVEAVLRLVRPIC